MILNLLNILLLSNMHIIFESIQNINFVNGLTNKICENDVIHLDQVSSGLVFWGSRGKFTSHIYDLNLIQSHPFFFCKMGRI